MGVQERIVSGWDSSGLGMKHEFCDIPGCSHVLDPETSWGGLCPGCLARLQLAFEASELRFDDYASPVLVFIFEEGLENDELWAERGLVRYEAR